MIKIIPQNEIEEILQNIKTILSTYKGTVPLMRDFGIDPNFVDNLQTESFKQKMKNEIIKQIQRFEPRIKVEKISLYSEDEKFYIWIKFSFKGLFYEGTYQI
ncbi:GPW/gp25 family protein [Persephonella sp.]